MRTQNTTTTVKNDNPRDKSDGRNHTTQLRPELRQAFEDSWKYSEEAYRYLAKR